VDVAVADTFRRRLVGLAWIGEPPPIALLIPRCASVHTVGMRFAIDVAFLGWPPREGGGVPVLAVRERLSPLRLAGIARRERRTLGSSIAALELVAGRARGLGLAPGIQLQET
jgi:hypothetical protein